MEKTSCLYTKEKTAEREKCDLCKCAIKKGENGFFICENKTCGVIYKDTLDYNPEWRYYGAADNKNSDPTRCGIPIDPLLQKSSYGCKVICNSRSSYEMRKIRRYTEWQAMPYNEKSMYEEFQRIKIMARQSGIQKLIVDEALRQHKKISQEKTFRGLNRDGIIAASIYIGCRINNFPRTPKEIATIFHLDNSSATKGCKNALTILNEIEKGMGGEEKTFFKQTKPVDFIDRYCSRLSVNTELTKLCEFIALRIENNNLIPENTPHSVAAGIIYFIAQVCDLNISKRDVYQVSEISEVTINKCYKKLYKMRKSLLPSAICSKYNCM